MGTKAHVRGSIAALRGRNIRLYLAGSSVSIIGFEPYLQAIRRIAEMCEMSDSKWEKGHLKKPVMPKRGAKKEE